jgi:ABC-type lipoprotein release transport system permease subunit
LRFAGGLTREQHLAVRVAPAPARRAMRVDPIEVLREE